MIRYKKARETIRSHTKQATTTIVGDILMKPKEDNNNLVKLNKTKYQRDRVAC